MAKTPIPPAIRVVLLTMMLNAIGFGIIVPVVPKIVMGLGHVPIEGAVAIGGHLSFIYAFMQFLFSPLVGNLSDRFGRRPVLLASLLGFAIDMVVFAFAPTLAWLFVARAFAGIFGASNGPAQSVIADIVRPEERARYFGLIGAAFGIGFVLGPVIGGLIGQYDHRLPFLVAGALAGANFLYALVALPETLDDAHRRRFDWRRANPFGALLQARHLKGIGLIAAAYLIWQIATLVYPLTWNYFTMGRYGWTEAMVGASLALVGLVMAAMQMAVLPRIVARLGERRTAMVGVAGTAMTMMAMAFATHSWMAWALFLPMAFQSLVQPNLTAMMTGRGDATTQGEVQGFASAIMAVGSVIAPLLFNPLQAYFTGANAPVHFYGAAFLLASLLAFAVLPLLARMSDASLHRPTEPTPVRR